MAGLCSWMAANAKPLTRRLSTTAVVWCRGGGGGGGGGVFALERLRQRSPILVSGKESSAFLQGLVTNDLRHLDSELGGASGEDFQPPPSKTAMYSMFLNVQGRVLFDVILFRGLQPDQVVLDCDRSVSERLLKHLKMYNLRRKVDIAPLADHEILVAFNQKDSSKLLPTIDQDDVISAVDPRVSDLGLRIIAPTGSLDELLDQHPTDDYRSLRHRLGVCEGADEIPQGNCFPLEYNADFMHGVSFHKGCYVGQELTARVHHTGVVRKRIMPLKLLQGQQHVEKDSNLTDENNKRIGKVRGQSGEYILALTRVSEALAAKEISVDGVKATLTKPCWWPNEAPKRRPFSSEESS